MSDRPDRVAAAVLDAITDALAADGGGFVTGFSLFINYTDEHGPGFVACAHPEQYVGETLGQLRMHTLHVEQQAERILGIEEREEDR